RTRQTDRRCARRKDPPARHRSGPGRSGVAAALTPSSREDLMSQNFLRPIRYRDDVSRKEYLIGAGSIVVLYLFACGMVIFNFAIPFTEGKFVQYMFPALVMLGIACLISHSRFLFWPDNPSKGDVLPLIIIFMAIVFWFDGRNFTFDQRILGRWEIYN